MANEERSTEPPAKDPAAATPASAKPAKPRKRRWRRLVALVVLVVVLLVVFGPLIASSGLVRGIVVGRINGSIPGSVEIEGIRLSWLGDQRVTGFKLLDPSGEPVVEFERLQIGASLVKLTRGDYDLGLTELSKPVISITRDANEQLNLDLALGRDPSDEAEDEQANDRMDSGGIMHVPPSLSGQIKVTDLILRVDGVQTTEIHGDAELTIEDISRPMALSLDATAKQGKLTGSVHVAGTLSGFNAEGVLHLDRVSAEVDAEVEDLPAEALDMLLGQNGVLHAATGESVSFSSHLKCANGIEGATQSVLLKTTNGRQEFTVEWAGGVLQVTKGQGVWYAQPALAHVIQTRMGRENPLVLAGRVEVELKVNRLSVPAVIDAPTRRVHIDLAAAAAEIVLGIGDVELTGDPTLGDIVIEGLSGSVGTQRLADAITLAASGDILQGSDRGGLQLNGTISDAVDADGRLQLDRLTTNIVGHLEQVPSALVDRVIDMGGVLEEMLGSHCDVDLTSTAGARQLLTLDVRSHTPRRFSGRLPVEIIEGVLRIGDAPAIIKGQATPALVAALVPTGQIGQLAAPVDYVLTITDLRLPIPGDGDPTLQPAASRLAASLELGDAVIGDVAELGGVRLIDVRADVGGASLTAMSATLKGRLEPTAPTSQLASTAGGVVDVNITANGGLGSDGGIEAFGVDIIASAPRADVTSHLHVTSSRVTLQSNQPATIAKLLAGPQMLAALDFAVEGQPTLAGDTPVELTVDALAWPLGGGDLSTARVTGGARIDRLMLAGDPRYVGMGLTNTTATFGLDGSTNQLALHVSGETQTPQRDDAGSLVVDATLSDVLRDGALAISEAPIEATIKVERLPTGVLALAGGQLSDLEPIVGALVSVDGRAKLTGMRPMQGTGTLAVRGDYLTADTAFRAARDFRFVKPGRIQWTMQPETYRSLVGDKAKQIDLLEPAIIVVTVDELVMPAKPDSGAFGFDATQAAVSLTVASEKLSLHDVVGKQRMDLTQFRAELVGERLSEVVAFDMKGHNATSAMVAATDVMTGGTAGAAVKPPPAITFITVRPDAKAPTKKSTDPEKIEIQGRLVKLFGPDGKLNLDSATVKIDGVAGPVPMSLVPGASEEVMVIVGRMFRVDLSADLKEMDGPINASIAGLNGAAEVPIQLRDQRVTLRKEVVAETLVNREIGAKVLKNINPLLVQAMSAEKPIRLTVPAYMEIPATDGGKPKRRLTEINLADKEGAWGFDIKRATIPEARLELGTIVMDNGDILQKLMLLLKRGGGKQLTARFTPLVAHLQGGIATYDRMDIILAESFRIATWGKADFNRNRIDMVLGLTAQTLDDAFGLEGLAEDYILQIPMRGTIDDPQVDFGAATTRIAALVAKKQLGGDEGEIIGNVLDIIGGGQDGDAPPAPENGQEQPTPEENKQPQGDGEEKEDEEDIRDRLIKEGLRQLFK